MNTVKDIGFILLVILLSYVLWVTRAGASEPVCTIDHIIVSHYSYHPTYSWYWEEGTQKRFNETNGGLGLECRINSNSWYWLGNYEDSYGGPAVYLGKYKAYYKPNYYMDLGMFYGAVVSREYNHRLGYGEYMPIPLALPALRLQYKSVGANITYKPRTGNKQSDVWGFALKVKF